MLKRLFYGIAGIVLVCISVFFAVIVAYLVSTEILPAIREGSLNIETSTMILNILWKGNEIYLLLSGYVVLSAGFAYGAMRIFRKATGG